MTSGGRRAVAWGLVGFAVARLAARALKPGRDVRAPEAGRDVRAPECGRKVRVLESGRARVNYRGRLVSLTAGPVLAVVASATAAAAASAAGRRDLAAAALLAGLAAGAVGRYDDLSVPLPRAVFPLSAGTAGSAGFGGAVESVQSTGDGGGGAPRSGVDKGLRGHLGALRSGRVTSGVIKLIGLTVAGLAAAAVLPSRAAGGAWRGAEVGLGAGVIAGSANLVNLLDLRPGRALKAGLVVAAPMAVGGAATLAGPVGVAVALLGDDLAERTMLGDCGANSLGALCGVAVVARTGVVGRAVVLAGLVALTLASERVSFTAVIESTPVLRAIDRLGRGAAG